MENVTTVRVLPLEKIVLEYFASKKSDVTRTGTIDVLDFLHLLYVCTCMYVCMYVCVHLCTLRYYICRPILGSILQIHIACMYVCMYVCMYFIIMYVILLAIAIILLWRRVTVCWR